MSDLGDVLRLPAREGHFVCKRCGALVADLPVETHHTFHVTLERAAGVRLWGGESAPDSPADGPETTGP